jgi:hypothetical protein
VAEVVEHLPGKHKVLRLNRSTTKKKKKIRNKKLGLGQGSSGRALAQQA